MRCAFVLAAVAGCNFDHGVYIADGAASDADVVADAMLDATPAFCPSGDAHLRLCFSFDQMPPGPMLANEGAANVSAQLTNVTWIPVDGGGAVQMGATSEIYVPYTAEVTAIRTIEIRYRFESDPTTNGARMGLVDSNVVPPNISLFFYRADPTHQLRCGLGSATAVWDATLAIGTWLDLVCTCDAGHLKMYVDGTLVGDTSGDCNAGGAFVDQVGFTIGANNNGGPTGINDQLLGAIDGIRLRDTTW